MQQRPDSSTLLEAVAQFLMTELLPTIQDKRLAFRVMIAANMANIVSGELRSDDDRYASEVKRLQALLPDVVKGDAANLPRRAQRAEALTALNRALADGLRKGKFAPDQLKAIQEHVKKTALETLAVENPRFDTSEEIE
jgi:hypothetical protein